MKSLSRNSPRNLAGYADTRGQKPAIPQFIPQFCGILRSPGPETGNPASLEPARPEAANNGIGRSIVRAGTNTAISTIITTSSRMMTPTTKPMTTLITITDALPIEVDLSAVAVAKVEARETDKALKEILEKLGI
jgi:hypothetical protein